VVSFESTYAGRSDAKQVLRKKHDAKQVDDTR